MLARGLRPSTIAKRLEHARAMLNDAVSMGLIATNPWQQVRHKRFDVSERRAYVPVSVIKQAMEYAPNVWWRLLLALARFAGLRIPSEAFRLTWEGVNWEKGRLIVPCQKTAGQGKPFRVVPLFPALKPYLEAAWEATKEGEVFVFPADFRKRAEGPRGWNGCNLRQGLLRILRRAGIEPWPRLWHSLRASCESDLAAAFPLATVAKWLGNTPSIALRHYVDPTDQMFELAKRWEPPKEGDFVNFQTPKGSVIDCVIVNAGTTLQGVEEYSGYPQNFSAIPQGACRNSLLHKDLLEDRGLEPLTFWMPSRRSPN